MRCGAKLLSFILLILQSHSALAQINRINYNKQQLFLNGSNLAWVNFANDVGPGATDFDSFRNIFLQMHDHGGNAMRWWLHTNGTVSPAFNDTGLVSGPGTGTIEDIRKVLDIAWEREIGVILCLWSFDMLRATLSPAILARNQKLLTDTVFTRAYINNCLIPMVDSLKSHPAIIGWEIFNEPEGMSSEFYFYSNDLHVPMSAIQRFVNLTAGAIHRRDSSALVTNGTWNFKALTDVTTSSSMRKQTSQLSQLSAREKKELETQFNNKYRMSMSVDEIMQYVRRVESAAN